MPRKKLQYNADQSPINIMWTHAGPMLTQGPWSPNRFVPCIHVEIHRHQDTSLSGPQCHICTIPSTLQSPASSLLNKSAQGTIHLMPHVSSKSRVVEGYLYSATVTNLKPSLTATANSPL